MERKNEQKTAIESIDAISRNIRKETQRTYLRKNKHPYMTPAVIIIIVMALFGLISISNFGQVATNDQQNIDTSDQDIAGDFELQDVFTMSEFKMSKYMGSLIVIDFMATWCEPCKYVYPELQELHQKYPQVEIFSVTTDPDYDTPNRLIDYASDQGISWHLARDINDVSNSQFQVIVIPTIILIDEKFDTEEKNEGVASFETMEQWILPKLQIIYKDHDLDFSWEV
ncbi:MAG: TlpA family protein disulfide reductase [Candidatus Hodarchaeales archaeon]